MSKKSAQNTSDVSGETRNTAGDVDDTLSAAELHHESEANYFVSNYATMNVESYGCETSEHSNTPCGNEELIQYYENHDSFITEAHRPQDSFVKEEQFDCRSIDTDEEEGDIQKVCEKDKVHFLGQLHLAAERGDTETVRPLLMSSANVDILDTRQNTPLHIATRNGHVDVVNLLLKNNVSVNSRNALGQTSLHLAAEKGHLAITRILLKSNADVHVTDQFMNTPIHIAASLGHYELVQLLMKYSFLLICYGNGPLHLAAKCGHTEVVQLLLNHGENPDATNLDGDTPLHLASQNGHCEVAEVLLRNNADANIRNAVCETPLHMNAKMGYAEIAKAMIDHEVDVNVVDINDDTALHHAASNGHFEVTEVLLRNNSDANIRNALCETPLHTAAEMGYSEIVKALIDHEVDVNVVDINDDTALHLSSENGHFQVVEVLLRNNADANIRNNFSETPLHIAADMGYTDIFKALIDHEGEVNAVDGNGDTALHRAASNDHIVVVHVNVLPNQTAERYAQIRLQLEENQVPTDEFEILQYPIRNKVHVGRITNQIAAEGGVVEIADTLPNHSYAVNADIKGQAKPLHHGKGHAEIVESLIVNGANVNACNNAKMTALHLACQNGHTSIVEILLDNHAVVDVLKQSQETPFCLAAENGHADISDLLLRRGVCDFVHRPWSPGAETPLLIAVNKGYADVVEVILKHSCRIAGKLKDGHTLQENAKNFVEARGIIPAELLKGDGRRVSAGIVWREVNTPLELRRRFVKYGHNALKHAAGSVKPEMVQLLLSGDQCVYSEKDLFESFESIIELFGLGQKKRDLKQYRNLSQVLINSSKFNVNHQDNEMNTLLHKMMQHCRISNTEWLNSLFCQFINDVIQLLLVKGANFNMKNSYGETPLIIVSEKGCCDAIQILFDWEHKSGIKLDLDARDQYGATALIKAAKGYHVSAVQLLLNHKASVNLYDYNGYTALHAAIYEPNRNWFDLHFFCKGLRKRKFDGDASFEINSKDELTWGEQSMEPYTIITKLEKIREHDEKTARIKEEIVKLLLANDATNVNSIEFKGNTPLDLAVKSSKRISSASLEALEDRVAIQNLLEPKDEAPIEVARVDKRGRNPLHRLIISRISNYANEDYMTKAEEELNHKRFDVMLNGILLRPENFRHLATATDDRGRTPLHYAAVPLSFFKRPSYLGKDVCVNDSEGKPTPLHYIAMKPSYLDNLNYYLVDVLLKLGSDLNAADLYGKTPLHYAEINEHYELFVHFGADENTKDKHGHTPKELKRLRESVTINEENARKLPIGKELLNACIRTAQVLNTNHVTELSKRKLVETIRIYSQSPRPQESSEEAIWKIWTQNEFVRLNRRLSQLKPSIHQFIERLADGIKEKDWRFECQPTLVGSADEETKATISADFDFSFKLIKFSQLCDPFPHPLGPNGYFQLRRKTNEDTKSRSDVNFACFFNEDQCLLTDEVNSRFQILVEEVFNDPHFWQDEHLFEWNLTNFLDRYQRPAGLCMTVRLRMINPMEDGEGDFLFVNISIDIAACIRVEDWWPEDPLPVGISSSVNTNGCIFVFHRRRFDQCKNRGIRFLFSDTFARISFAPLESRFIRESSLLIKGAFIVCKMILRDQSKSTYQFKNCLLFCMEALSARNGSEIRTEPEITPKQLAFWVERLMFCFMEFSRHDFYPCYFMPSFRQPVSELDHWGNELHLSSRNFLKFTLKFSKTFGIYLDLCPDDTAVDIPIVDDENDITEESLNANHDPMWEQFDREDFIRNLSSRIVPAN